MKDKPTTKIQRAKARKLSLLLKDKDELRAALNRGAKLTVQMNLLSAAHNERVLALEEVFHEATADIADELGDIAKSVQTFAEMNRATLFDKKQSVEINGHELAYRDNGGAVTTAKKVTQEGALNRLLSCVDEAEAIADKFVVWKASLDKKAIKDLYADYAEFLEAMGLLIEHEEKFTLSYNLAAEAQSATTTLAERTA